MTAVKQQCAFVTVASKTSSVDISPALFLHTGSLFSLESTSICGGEGEAGPGAGQDALFDEAY